MAEHRILLSNDVEYLRNQVADRWDRHPVENWSPALLKALIATFDMYIESNPYTQPAPLLNLVRAEGNQPT